MGKLRGEEYITNEDGSSLKVQSYDDKIVVHEFDSSGEHTGHVTDWFDNPGVHVHVDNVGEWFEGGKK